MLFRSAAGLATGFDTAAVFDAVVFVTVDFCADFAIRASALAASEDFVFFDSAIFFPWDTKPPTLFLV